MNNNIHVILGVHVHNRTKDAVQVQSILSTYGRNIKTRLGLHEVNENHEAAGGVLILEMHGSEAVADELAEKLGAIEGLDVQKMVFGHD